MRGSLGTVGVRNSYIRVEKAEFSAKFGSDGVIWQLQMAALMRATVWLMLNIIGHPNAGSPGEGVAKNTYFGSVLHRNNEFLSFSLKEGETAKVGTKVKQHRAHPHTRPRVSGSARDYSSVYESEVYGSAAVWRC
ncbi:hypothetical protein B0H13DRAFT_1932797 [Mycena leptocephala]|nr:hypothetical protein B0H13DRAFT_1932797 [Mycena leptocephala]